MQLSYVQNVGIYTIHKVEHSAKMVPKRKRHVDKFRGVCIWHGGKLKRCSHTKDALTNYKREVCVLDMA